MSFEFIGSPYRSNEDIKLVVFFKEPIDGYRGAICCADTIFSHSAFVQILLRNHPSLHFKKKLKKNDNIFIYSIELAKLGHLTLTISNKDGYPTFPENINDFILESTQCLSPFIYSIQNMTPSQFDSKGKEFKEPLVYCGKDFFEFLVDNKNKQKPSKSL